MAGKAGDAGKDFLMGSLNYQADVHREVSGKMQKIMIIEDDPAIRDELALLLENEGYQQIGRASCRERV